MNAIQIISQDLFDKVRSRFSNLEMGDETGAVVIDPAEARYFDFDFVIEGNNLGRVSISLNDAGTLKVYYSQGITENHDDPIKKKWFGFLREMRLFAMRRLLRFDTRDIAKSNLDKNDFQHLAKTQAAPKEEEMTTMNESRWNGKSTKKTSRAVKGRTEVIIRHAQPVDEMFPGARSQKKNIKAIFIQNHDGERFKYPFIHPAGAFAMAQHVDHGGVPHDPAGKAIIKMSEQIAQLGEFQRKVHSATLHDDATGIKERALGRMNELKAQIDALGKRHHYENWINEFQGMEDEGDTMLDDVTMEQYKQTFTQTSFQEELSQFFPLLHKIMSETNTVDLEDYVGEAFDVPGTSSGTMGQSVLQRHPEDEFQEWADATEQGKLTDDQIANLKRAIETQKQSGQPLQLGPNGQTAWDFFTGAVNPEGSEGPSFSDDLKTKLQDAANVDPETDGMEVFQVWAQQDYPELAVALGMSGTTKPAQGQEQPTNENEEQGGMPNKTMPTREAVVKEVAKLVKSRFNEDNPEVGPFNGAPNIALDVKKKCAEMFGDEVADQCEHLALEFMEKLTKKWEAKHGPVEDDGLSRLKELLGNVKEKVESIGDQGNGGTDFNTNIMPSEEVDKSQIPAAQRKEKGGDWKMSTTDLEKEKSKSPTSSQGLSNLKSKLGMKEDIADILKLSGLAK